MTSYSRSAYGTNPHAGASRNNAAARGWGSGWPNCQTSRMTVVSKAGVRVSVRREIAQLVATLMAATEQRYGYDIKSGQTWGFACRAIRGTSTASNHSWGLAVDINSLANPMAYTFKSDIPPAVVHMWEACGFYWGGRYANRPDAMHFEYIFRPADVAGHLGKATAYLSGDTSGGTGGGSSTKFETYRKNVKPGSRTIRKGNAGDDVKFVQRFIGEARAGKADGYFGPRTDSAVRWYQKMRGIGVDGIVGPVTWRNML